MAPVGNTCCDMKYLLYLRDGQVKKFPLKKETLKSLFFLLKHCR